MKPLGARTRPDPRTGLIGPINRILMVKTKQKNKIHFKEDLL